MTRTPIADRTALRKTTPWRRFVGMNIKGTPPMRAARVEHDLKVARDDYHADIIVTQEMRWSWYFRRVARVLRPRRRRRQAGPTWGHAPGLRKAIAAPVFAAQAVFWRSDLMRRRGTRRRILHRKAAGISDTRHLRGILLAERDQDDPDMALWAGTTHLVVGADRRGDPQPRQEILYREDLPALDAWLGSMLATGHPALVQLDANIAKGSAAYDDLRRIVEKHGGRIVGEHGVEYLLRFHGSNGVRVDIRQHWQIPANKLETDHEGRGCTYRLRKPAHR